MLIPSAAKERRIALYLFLYLIPAFLVDLADSGGCDRT